MFAEPRVAELAVLGTSLRLIGPLPPLGAEGASSDVIGASSRVLDGKGGNVNAPVDGGPMGIAVVEAG